jgi:hypothetical protein
VELFPNPAGSATLLKFELTTEAEVEIKLYDIAGRELKTISSGRFSEGINRLSINRENLSSGLYFVSIRINGALTILKVIFD